MIRIFARRPLVFIALALCLGAFVMVKCLESNSIIAFCVLLLILTAIAIFAFIIFSIKSNNRFIHFVSINRFIILGCLIMYVVGGLFTYNKINFYTTNIEEADYTITGIVKECDEFYSTQYIYLRNVVIVSEGEQENLKGVVCLSFSSNSVELEQVDIGDKISFEGSIESNLPIKNGGLDYYSIKDNVRYNAEYIQNFKIIEKDLININDRVRFTVLDTLLNEMPSQIAYLSYSILFGDSSYLSDFTNESFKISGVAHIVAVSGMNVVIIVSLLLFLMRFIKSRKLLKFLIITFILIAYCYMCDFTPSVVRATIMALVVLSAKFIGRQGDILSSLGLSCIIICIIWPLSIFDVGFLMSFASVLGIVMFFGGINYLLNKKCKIPNFLSSSIAVTVSAQIGIYPIMASYFNSFSLYSIPANIVIVPIFSLAYVLLFATVIISLILPFLSFLLFLPSVVMSFVNWFPSVFVNLPFANLYVFELGVFSIIYYACLIFISSFVFIQNKVKIPINILLILSMLTYFVLDLLPKKYKSDNASVFDTYSPSVLVTTIDNNKFLVGVGNKYDTNSLTEAIQRARIYNLNAVFIINNSVDAYKQRTNIEALLEVCKIDKLYVTDNMSESFTTMNGVSVQTIPNNDCITINESNIYPLYVQNDLVALLFDLDNKDYAFILDINNSQSYYVRSMINSDVNIFCFDIDDYRFFENYPKLQ